MTNTYLSMGKGCGRIRKECGGKGGRVREKVGMREKGKEDLIRMKKMEVGKISLGRERSKENREGE